MKVRLAACVFLCGGTAAASYRWFCMVFFNRARFGLETAMGRNLKFDFEDYLGQVQEEPDRLSFHQKMEAALKM